MYQTLAGCFYHSGGMDLRQLGEILAIAVRSVKENL